MAEEGKGIALAILGIIVIIAVAGMVLLFKGGTGQASYSYVKPFTMITPTAQKACSILDCQNGVGAVIIGEETHLDGEYWVCGCPAQFMDKRISDWSYQWKGDESHDGLDFGNYDAVWRVRKIREY